MKKIYLLIILQTFIFCGVNAQTWEWTKPEPNGIDFINFNPLLGQETEDAHDVETDAAGNVYVLGDFNDSLYLNNIFRESGAGSYLVKYDSTGNLLWYKTIVPTEYNDAYNRIKATDLTVNAQGVFITGKYFGSYFTSYLCDGSLNIGVDFSYKIGSYTFTSARNDVGLFITKMDGDNGNVLWNKTATEPPCAKGGQWGIDILSYNPFITSDKEDNIIVSFTCGSPRPSMMIGGDVIALNGNYISAGSFLVAVKYDANGIFQWSNYAGGVNTGDIYDVHSIITDNEGAVYFTGACGDSCFFGNQLFRFNDAPTLASYLAKISATGTWQFVKELSNTLQHSKEGVIGNPTTLATDNANNVYALVNTAISQSNTDSLNLGGLKIAGGLPILDNFIVKFNSNGNTAWAKNFGALESFAPGDATAIYYSANNLYITGSVRNYWPLPYNFSKLYVPSTVCGQGMLNSFVAKADTSADFKWVTTFCGAFNNQNFGVAVSGNNVYTCGYYTSGVDGLGNLNGAFISNGQEHNTFIGKLKDQYIHVGAVAPTTLCAGNAFTIPFTSFGLTFSNANTFTAQISDANGNFTNAANIGSATSTGSGFITATLPDLPSASSSYRVRIVSSDLLNTGYPYYAYADTGYALTVDEGCATRPPVITSFSPSSGPVGTNVTITGTNFNATSSSNIVYFGAVKAMVTTGTSTSLTVTAPAGATYQPISVLDNAIGLAGYSSKPFIITFTNPFGIGIPDNFYKPNIDFSTGTNPRSVPISDLDGDGKPDMIVANSGSNTISVLRNTSVSGSINPSSFADKIDFTAGTDPRSVAIGDLDGDGKPDMVIANFGSGTISVLLNTSTSGSIAHSSFTSKVDFAGTSPFYVTISDVDSDGKPDLVVANLSSNTISIFRNTSTPGSINASSFAAKVDFATVSGPVSIAVGDVDGDGKPDLVVGNAFTAFVSVMRNTSTSGNINASSFASKVDFATSSGLESVAIGDVDGDGKLDVVVANVNANTISVLRNTSTSGSIDASSFAVRIDFPTGANPFYVVIGDVDGDGKPDMVSANYGSNTISLLRNTSASGSINASSFASKVDFTAGTAPVSLAISDLDGDGIPEIAAANNISNKVSVFQIFNPSTTITVTSSINPSTLGQNVTFTAPVATASGTPTGSVTFFDESTSLGSCILSGTAATFSTLSLTGGTHNITAVYNGDANYASSTSSVLIQVVTTTFYQDNDGDSYGSTVTTQAYNAPAGYVTTGGDCDDANASVHPGATEICDGKDNNCDGVIDEGFPSVTYYRDADGDGYGSAAVTTSAKCSAPAGYVSNNTDCNDADASIHPGAVEICDGKDNNCDGVIDEGFPSVTYYRDADSDGYGNAAVTTTAKCSAPAGYVSNNTDCNDADARIHPGAVEICDGKDNNCDGVIDEGFPSVTYYRDADGDGYGNAAVTVTAKCSAPAGYVSNNTDCDDADATIYPGAPELCDGKDNNCNGTIDEGCATTPSISINDVTVYESQGIAVLTVRLSNTSTQATKVNYQTVDGTAVSKGKGKNPPIDFVAAKGTLTIPAGSLTGTISITIINDGIAEPTEYFDVLLSLMKNSNATISDGSGRVTILNGTPLATKSLNTNSIKDVLADDGTKVFGIRAYPNPSGSTFRLFINSDNKKDKITLAVTDVLGRLVEVKGSLNPWDRIEIGASYRPGIYFAKIIQGEEVRMIKLVKGGK